MKRREAINKGYLRLGIQWSQDRQHSPEKTTRRIAAIEVIRPEFLKRLQVRMTGCWEWKGKTFGFGYGFMNIERINVSAHRVAWEAYHGMVPDGLCVLHRCDNPRCANPLHLFLGTDKDNADDKVSKNRQRTNGNDRKTHCKRGHPLSGDNLGIRKPNNSHKNPTRYCRICGRESHKKWASK